MTKNLAALISLAIVLTGSLGLSTQSAEAKGKNSQNNSHLARNYFVPPPPPYTPSIDLSGLVVLNGQVVSATTASAVVAKPVKTNSDLNFDPRVEAKVQKQIDSFDSEISSVQKEIGKLLAL